MSGEEALLTQAQAFEKAQELIKEIRDNNDDDGKTKSHALLLVYNPEREAFQMVAINSDADEVVALVLSCLATVRQSLKDVSEDRTLN